MPCVPGRGPDLAGAGAVVLGTAVVTRGTTLLAAEVVVLDCLDVLVVTGRDVEGCTREADEMPAEFPANRPTSSHLRGSVSGHIACA